MKSVSAGVNPMGIRRGIDKAVIDAVAQIQKVSTPIKEKEEIAQVASVSANNDHTIGDEIANAMEKVGLDGVITVEESKTIDTTTDYVEGMATINEPIRASVQISGFGQKEANDLAIVLKTAALPIQLTVANQQSVGATLGEDSVNQGMTGIARRSAPRALRWSP